MSLILHDLQRAGAFCTRCVLHKCARAFLTRSFLPRQVSGKARVSEEVTTLFAELNLWSKRDWNGRSDLCLLADAEVSVHPFATKVLSYAAVACVCVYSCASRHSCILCTFR